MIRRWLSDMRAGARILASRDFWRAFRDYYSEDAIAGRLDDFAARVRKANGKPIDPDLERRRADRRARREAKES